MEKMSNLPPEGLLLYDDLQKCANLVKEESSRFLMEAREEMKRLTKQFQDFLTHEIQDLDALTTLCIESNDCSKWKELLTKMTNYKIDIKKWRTSLDEFASNPPGREKLQLYIDNFNDTLSKLKEYASKINFSIPWQVEYMAVANTTDPNAKVDFEGGKITDSNGRSIWAAICSVCDIEIQDGAKGQGIERYHCLDCEKVDQCVSCYRRIKRMKEYFQTNSELMEGLLELDPHLNHVIEYSHLSLDVLA